MRTILIMKKIFLALSMIFLFTFYSRTIPSYHTNNESGPTTKDEVYSITPSHQNI